MQIKIRISEFPGAQKIKTTNEKMSDRNYLS
jgi:hypothetical protein